MTIALVDKNIKELILKKVLKSNLDLKKYVQPASLDVPIGNKAYLINEKFIPFKKNIEKIIKDNNVKEIDISKGEILYKNQTYLIPTIEINLPENKYIKISPKSSIGRIDLFVRGIIDNIGYYDYIPSKTKGRLWLEITPQSFNVKIKKGISLTQLMVLENRENKNIDLKNEKLLYNNKNKPINCNFYDKNKIVLSLNLNKSEIFGYEAKHTNQIIDLTSKEKIDYRNFFKKIELKNITKYTLEKDKFYIISTKEKISVPLKYSAEMIPSNHMIGELRAHYAGFFDPGWGYGKKGEIKGAKGTLEIRAHENITVYDAQPICLIEYFENLEIPKKPYGYSNNNYQGQNKPKLAKYFKE
jgi:dCTP deaminase